MRALRRCARGGGLYAGGRQRDARQRPDAACGARAARRADAHLVRRMSRAPLRCAACRRFAAACALRAWSGACCARRGSARAPASPLRAPAGHCLSGLALSRAGSSARRAATCPSTRPTSATRRRTSCSCWLTRRTSQRSPCSRFGAIRRRAASTGRLSRDPAPRWPALQLRDVCGRLPTPSLCARAASVCSA